MRGTRRFIVSGWFFASLFTLAPHAEARRCLDNPDVLASDMKFVYENLQATWENGVGGDGVVKYGMMNLFSRDGVCFNCHNAAAECEPSDDGHITTCAEHWTVCADCHAGSMGGKPNPDWLNFWAADGSSSKLLRNSYSWPGKTKAHASLYRIRSGSMAPQGHGWCEEIDTVFEQWIRADFP